MTRIDADLARGLDLIERALIFPAPAGTTSDTTPRGRVGLSFQQPAGALYYCTVCGANPVDADAGFDTCDDCHP